MAELVVESRRRSDSDQLIFGMEKVRKGQRKSAGCQKVRLLCPPGCRLQVPAGVVDAELEVEVVEVEDVVELLPLKLLPLLLRDLAHGSANQL